MKKFIELFSEQYDDLDASTLSLNTEFRDIEGYSSVTALMILSMVDEEFGVTLTGDEMRACRTIGDLFNLVISKK